MSAPELPAMTDAEKIIFILSEMAEKIGDLRTAVNTTGQQTQWLIDNVGGILSTFADPRAMSGLMAQMGGMLGGGNGGRPAADAG